MQRFFPKKNLPGMHLTNLYRLPYSFFTHLRMEVRLPQESLARKIEYETLRWSKLLNLRPRPLSQPLRFAAIRSYCLCSVFFLNGVSNSFVLFKYHFASVNSILLLSCLLQQFYCSNKSQEVVHKLKYYGYP